MATGVRSCSCWKRETNVSRRFRDSASAALLDLPGTCLAMYSNLNSAWKKNKHLSRCVIIWSLDDLEVTAITAAMLSQQNSTVFPDHSFSQIAALATIGRSSLAGRYPWTRGGSGLNTPDRASRERRSSV